MYRLGSLPHMIPERCSGGFDFTVFRRTQFRMALGDGASGQPTVQVRVIAPCHPCDGVFCSLAQGSRTIERAVWIELWRAACIKHMYVQSIESHAIQQAEKQR